MQDEANAVFFSVASIWEIGIKFGRGKLPDAGQLIADLRKGTALPHFTLLPITPEHAIEAGCAQIAHRDPFDRMLVCQARLEGLTIVSNERVFDGFGVARLWD